jgi:hypothetical protein
VGILKHPLPVLEKEKTRACRHQPVLETAKYSNNCRIFKEATAKDFPKPDHLGLLDKYDITFFSNHLAELILATPVPGKTIGGEETGGVSEMTASLESCGGWSRR